VRVAEIMQREVPKVAPDATLREAARTLRKWESSAVVVVDDDRPVGILTERDLVQVVVDGEDAAWVRVDSRMSTDLVSVSSHTDSEEAMELMAARGIRHLPVLDGSELVGIVSLQDHVTKVGSQSTQPGADVPYRGGSEPGRSFHGPYFDGPPASALVVETPTLSRFGLVELRRMAVIVVVLHLSVLRSLLRVLHRPSKARLAAAGAKGLVDGFELLGPTYVKLGQLIASSPGIFPKPLSDEAMRCLDEVPPFDGATCKELIRRQLGRPVNELFASFDEEPLAAASVGQVHACVLLDGRDAVVKLQRPDIRARMGTDLRIMHRLARIMERFSRTARSANLVGVVEDLHAVTFQELNPVLEAYRQTRFRDGISAFGDNTWVTAPEVYWDYCGPNMICMERLYGFPVDDFETLRERGIDGALFLRRGVKVWMEAALCHGPFHGDVHAGNLWMLNDGRLAFLDFGIMGELQDDWKQLLRDQFTTTMLDNDFSRVARAFKRVGAFPEEAGTDEEVGMRMQMVFSPMLDAGLSDVNLGELLASIVALMDQYSKDGTPRELVLVIKQLLYFERYAKELAPDWLMFRDLFLMKNILGQPVTAAIAERGMELPE